MKHSIASKFIAILLAACSLVAAAGSAVAVAFLGAQGMYAVDYETWIQEKMNNRAENLTDMLADRYAVSQFSNCPADVLEDLSVSKSDAIFSQYYDLEANCWGYTLVDEQGTVLEETAHADMPYAFTFRCSGEYPVLSDAAENSYAAGQYYIRYETSPEYEVTVWMTPDALQDTDDFPLRYIQAAFAWRYGVIVILAASLLVFAICAVYLCCAAGKSKKSAQVEPGGLNRMPLDLYAVFALFSCWALLMLAYSILDHLLFQGAVFNPGAIVLTCLVLLVAAVIGIGFFFAVAAQFKAKKRYWWHHSVIGFTLGLIWKGLRFVFLLACKLLRMLPLIWKWILIGIGMGFFSLLFIFFAMVGRDYWILLFLLSLASNAAIICYGAYAYGTLLKGAEQMAKGNLHNKISTRYLIGSYRKCAEDLNALADVATVAAKNQMKSERMKTELITNVSHDIKTPLTSIINYVDLLEKPHTPEEGSQYLEVLGRQSQRLKKLIEDLMEMSKATTGNMSVDITQVDAAEAINQALGEFSDKLAAAHLTPVFRQPESVVAMEADGRMTWRVLSNLLSNIVKYALPGTRVYIDLTKLDNKVLISLKNISREALNGNVDELTERFVRGDASRNTEGSGLGLNIAQSLMELQKGQLQLLVDGDLFKVTLVFPAT